MNKFVRILDSANKSLQCLLFMFFPIDTSYTTSESSTDQPIPELFSSPLNNNSSIYRHKADNSKYNCQHECVSKSNLLPKDSLTESMYHFKFDDAIYKNRSLCSMNCVARKVLNLQIKKSQDFSMNSTDAEKQIGIGLDLNSLRSTDLQSIFLHESSLVCNKKISVLNTGDSCKRNEKGIQNGKNQKRSLFQNATVPNATTCFFFSRKKHKVENNMSVMKKSKKCTNIIKYKNLSDEPPLKLLTNECMLLGKYKLKVSKDSCIEKPQYRSIACETIPKETYEGQSNVVKKNQSSQNAMTSMDYDRITEDLMVSIFQKQTDGNDTCEVTHYIDEVVRDLYDTKVVPDVNPVKTLFRCLLEYWLKNTSVSQFKEAMISAKSIERQSNKYFTSDKNLSSVFIHMISKQTQCHGLSNVVKKEANTKHFDKITRVEKTHSSKCQSPSRDTEKQQNNSFEKEKRIQELEKLLKNTIYVCETQGTNKCREKDIKITQNLINNLGSKKPEFNNSEKPPEKSGSSTELPEMQDTINHLINDTAIPPDIAKEFLGAYLDVLLHDETKSATTSLSSDWSDSRESPVCQVQTEPVTKKVFRNVTTVGVPIKSSTDNKKSLDNGKPLDPGQVHLKDVLGKITTIFSKVNKNEQGIWEKNKAKLFNDEVEDATKDELGRPLKICSNQNVIYKNIDEKSLVIDLSLYDLEHISIFNDTSIKGMMSITIKLKEKILNSGESKQTHLNMKFADEVKPIVTPVNKSDNWMSLINDGSTSRDIFHKTLSNDNHPCTGVDASNEWIHLKPYSSTSDASSKLYRFLHKSDNSISLKSSNSMKHITVDNKDLNSCYLMSSKKTALATKFQSKKKVKLEESFATVLSSKDESPCTSQTARSPNELTVFEKPTPRVIDEKFILLLLENLKLLSKNVPTLYKDINSLFMKLRKKHEKVVKNCSNIQGLSLLGKIYNEESYVNGSNDKTTQIELELCKKFNDCKSCGTNTKSIKNVTDKVIDTCSLVFLNHIKIQTKVNKDDIVLLKADENDLKEPKVETKTCNREKMSVSLTETIDIDSVDQSTYIFNGFKKTTEDIAIGTVIRYVSHYERSPSPHNATAKPNRIKRESQRMKKHTPEMRQNLINELSLLSPSFKVSTHSQTDKQMVRFKMGKNKGRKFQKDFNLYQLFFSQKYGLKETSSITIADLDKQSSDDMYTLYRCTSDPATCSG